MITGIYKIKLGSYYYIGSSNNIQRRTTKHLQHLREGKHINPFLQNVYNKHSSEWKVEILEETEESKLLSVEQKYLDQFYGKEGCLNLVPTANKPPSAKGKKHPAWVCRKISESKKGWKPSEETIANMTIAARKRCADPKVLANMRKAFKNRPKKLKPFYLIKEGTKIGPFLSLRECRIKTQAMSCCSFSNLYSGKVKEVRGYKIEIISPGKNQEVLGPLVSY